MTSPSQFERLFSNIQQQFERELAAAREVFDHPGMKGDATEGGWISLLTKHLPHRYEVDKAKVIDSEGNVSDQLDIVIYDRHFTPVLYDQHGQRFIPAESVYAVFEAKQELTTANVTYARQKLASVRRLRRTSAPIVHAGGTLAPRALFDILGGILTYQSGFSPPLSEAALTALQMPADHGVLNLSCVADTAALLWNGRDLRVYRTHSVGAFYLLLVQQLQAFGTVAPIEYDAYLRHFG